MASTHAVFTMGGFSCTCQLWPVVCIWRRAREGGGGVAVNAVERYLVTGFTANTYHSPHCSIVDVHVDLCAGITQSTIAIVALNLEV